MDIKRLVHFGEFEVQEKHWKLEDNDIDTGIDFKSSWEANLDYEYSDHLTYSEEIHSFGDP